MSKSPSPFGQVFKKRGGNEGNTGESTFETNEEKTKIPDINGIMEQVDRNLNETRNIVVRKEERTMDNDSCHC